MSNTTTLERPSLELLLDPFVTEQEVDDSFKEITDPIDARDMQRNHINALRHEPAEVIYSGAVILQQVSAQRSIRRQRASSVLIDFATRTPDGSKIDARYSLAETADGQISGITIISRLQGSLEEPCVISLHDNTVRVEERIWQGGRWQYLQRSLTPGERGERLYHALAFDMIVATDKALTRPADEKQAADAQARQLMIQQIKTIGH